MEITFKLTPQDLMALDRYLYKRRYLRFPNVTFTGSILALALFLAGRGANQLIQGKPLEFWIVSPLAILTLPATGGILQVVIQRLRTQKNAPEILATRILKFEPEGVGIYIREEPSYLRWSAVQRIEKQGRRVFLVLGENLVMVIPPTVFGTSEALDSFVTKIQLLWEQGKSADAHSAAAIATAELSTYEVRFTYLPEDILAVDRLIARRNSINPWISVIAFLIVGVLVTVSIGFYFAEDWRNSNDQTVFHTLVMFILVFLLTVVVIGGVAAFIHTRLRNRRYRSLGKSIASIFQPRLLRLEEESVFYVDATGERTVPWKSVSEIVEDAERLYLFQGPRAVVPIPRNAFASPAEMQEFIRFARARWRASRTSGDDNPW